MAMNEMTMATTIKMGLPCGGVGGVATLGVVLAFTTAVDNALAFGTALGTGDIVAVVVVVVAVEPTVDICLLVYRPLLTRVLKVAVHAVVEQCNKSNLSTYRRTTFVYSYIKWRPTPSCTRTTPRRRQSGARIRRKSRLVARRPLHHCHARRRRRRPSPRR